MKSSVHVERVKGKEVQEVASSPINGAVNGYYNVVIGKIAADRYGLLADAGVGAHSSSAVMMAWNEGKLSKIYPQPKPNGEVTENNARQTYGGDGNGDGILDIDVTIEAPGQEPGLAYSQLCGLSAICNGTEKVNSGSSRSGMSITITATSCASRTNGATIIRSGS